MLKNKIRFPADGVANICAGGLTARFAPELAPLGACKRTLQSSGPDWLPCMKEQMTPVVEVVVKENA